MLRGFLVCVVQMRETRAGDRICGSCELVMDQVLQTLARIAEGARREVDL